MIYSNSSRVIMAGVILFSGLAWVINLLLNAGLLALISHYWPALYRNRGEILWYLVALFSTIISVNVVMWIGWAMSDGHWGFLYMGIYTFFAAANEFLGERSGDKDSVSAWGSLTGHMINVICWVAVWRFLPGS